MRKILAFLPILLMTFAVADEEIPGLEIEKIKDGIYLHRSYSRVDGFGLVSSNGLVVADGENAYMVDTPWSERDTEKLVNWIRENGFTLAGGIATHSHDDRAAGIEWLNAHGFSTYAFAMTNRFLEEAGKEKARHSFDGERLSLGDGLIEAFYPGPGHTKDNVVVWIHGSEILHGGCFVRSLESRGLGYTGEADIGNWPASVENVLQRYPDAKTVIPGHGGAGDIRLLEHTQSLAEAARKE
jgi:metallo-beta-lactamase class B/metallo-beta-lactamase class B GIM